MDVRLHGGACVDGWLFHSPFPSGLRQGAMKRHCLLEFLVSLVPSGSMAISGLSGPLSTRMQPLVVRWLPAREGGVCACGLGGLACAPRGGLQDLSCGDASKINNPRRVRVAA